MTMRPNAQRFALRLTAVTAIAVLAGSFAFQGLGSAQEASNDAASSNGAEEASAEFKKINFSVNRGLYSIAIPKYEKLLEKYPSFPDRAFAQYCLALCHSNVAAKIAANRPDAQKEMVHHRKAVMALRSGLADKSFPKERQVEAQDLLAQSLLYLGDHDGAVSSYRWIFERTEGVDKALAAIGLADAEFSRQAFDVASKAYRDALEILPIDADDEIRQRAKFQLAMSLYHTGSDKTGGGAAAEAVPLFESLAKTSGGIGEDSLYMAALTNQRTGKLDAAELQYKKLAALDNPSLAEAGLYGLGAVLFQREKFVDASERLDAFVKLHPKSRHVPNAQLFRARALLEQKKLRSAGTILLSLIDNKEVGEEAGLWLARAYASLDKHESAVKILKRTIAAHPTGKHRQLLDVELATELVASDKFDEAKTTLAGVDASGKNADRTSYLRAYALHRSKDYESSAKACAEFLTKHADSGFAQDVRRLAAENQFLLGRFEEAMTAYSDHLAKAKSLSARDRLLVSYRVAEAKFFSKKYPEAIAALRALLQGPSANDLRSAVASDPLFASFHYLLGEALYQTRAYKESVAEFTAYLAPAASHQAAGKKLAYAGEARFKLAHANQLSGDLPAARAAYRAALQTDPRGQHASQIRFEIGQIAFEAGELAEAKTAFEGVVSNDPDSKFTPFALRFLGWIAQQENRHEDAIRWLEKVVDGDPKHEIHGESLYLLSLSLQKTGDFARSRQMIDRLRREHPDDPRLHSGRLQEAIAFAREGNDEKCIEIIDSLKLGEFSAEVATQAWYEKAWALRRLKKDDEAIASYRKLLALGAESELSHAALLELAELLFDAEKIDEAKKLLAGLSSTTGPAREKALYQLCWCYYRLKDANELETSFQALRSSFPKSEHIVQTALLSARTHLEKKSFRTAAERFKLILDTQPRPKEAEQAAISYAECLSEQRDFRGAIAQLTAFERDYPKTAYKTRASFALGWAHENLVKFDAAEKHYTAAAKDSTAFAARAQFQLGQLKIARKKYEDAVVEFLFVTGRFGNYPEWASRALLQVAGCFTELEDYEKAREYYSEVVEKYGSRDEGRLAKQKLAALPR